MYFKRLIISPHLDDAVFSCGGLIANTVKNQDHVAIINVFTELPSNEKNKVSFQHPRHQEEKEVASFLKYSSFSLNECDAVLRHESYRKVSNLFRPPHPSDIEIYLPGLRKRLFAFLANFKFDELYIPLGVGWHVDHILVHQVFDEWDDKNKLFYYEDAPYCLIPNATRSRLDELGNYKPNAYDLSLVHKSDFLSSIEAAQYYYKRVSIQKFRVLLLKLCAALFMSAYFYKLLKSHHSNVNPSTKEKKIVPTIFCCATTFSLKLIAAKKYASQFKIFFKDDDEFTALYLSYAKNIEDGIGALERYWKYELIK